MAEWFITNVADAPAVRGAGSRRVSFEPDDAPFPDYGINIRVLEPGRPACLYHSENAQEDFLVLAGECLVIVDGEERSLRAWDFVHCPAGVEHVFIGAGSGPCAVLMVGARPAVEVLHYPVNEVAARHGASATVTTDSPGVAYANWPRSAPDGHLDWPIGG